MALPNQNDAVYTSTSDEALASPPPTTLPFDLVVEILCRLPVKFLLQFRSVCKLWNSLISDPKFAQKHLSLSTTHRINSVYYSITLRKYIFESYSLNSIFSTIYTNVTQLEYPPNGFDVNYHPNCAYSIVGSCNGILCLALFDQICIVLVWNPSIRKFKELPNLVKPKVRCFTSYGFGYDLVNDVYKAVVVFRYSGVKTEVKVHTLGTNFWKSVERFPFGCVPCSRSGTFVSGTINWLAFKDETDESFIVSFDLGTESYQEILQPNYGDNLDCSSLGVLRDCLCLISYHDVWIMKEFGNKDSWTKLFVNTDPGRCYYSLSEVIHTFSDHQFLLEASHSRAKKLILHDPKTGNIKFINFKNKYNRIARPVVCVESLISP
ncbi:F-box/kelch-repeat protein At3g23880-like [Vicia villosa]|uniref:F-box/kelch-repeat protein At3g23880-like n=1 Tax=Vicia villosa TaxID=3911 RepID=UPI00273C2EC7|nr:F-box/kelch-repeat protein At3g23880-like [Vicia villosa]